MRVVVRADASALMGTGHLRRCLSLIEALLEQGAQVWLISRRHDNVGPSVLLRAPCPVLWLEISGEDLIQDPDDSRTWAGVPWSQDAAQTEHALRGLQPDWIIVDHYGLDARWHKVLVEKTRCKLLVLDDLADRPLGADLVLDHNWCVDHQAKYEGLLDEKVRWLVGPRFALLAPAYRIAPRYQFSSIVRSVGIFMGGTDPDQLSAKFLKLCREDAGFRGPIEVVSTSANPGLETLRISCAGFEGVTLSIDEPDLAVFFARHDLQIGAGGGATWERCCIGVPTIAAVVAANQRVTVPALDTLGVLAAARLSRPKVSHDTAEAPDFLIVFRRLLADPDRRRALAENASTLVDGRGAQRVALCLMMEDGMQLRLAGLADAPLLHGWRNHPEARAMSSNSAVISFSEHMRWLQSVVESSDRWLLIAMVGNLPVGSLRFDRVDVEQAEVSLYLDPQLRDLGLGGRMLLAGEAWLFRRLAGPYTVSATVLASNGRSQQMFIRCGYTGGPLHFSKRVTTDGTAVSLGSP